MAVDTVRKSINVTTPVSPTTVTGWPAVIFSFPVLGVGVFIVLLALDVVPSPDTNFRVSRELVAAFGGLFVLAGVSVLVQGLQSLAAQSKRKEILSRHPGQPWLADYPWDPKGISGDNLKKVYSIFGGMLGIIVFLVPFHWFAFFTKGVPPVFGIFIGIFDLILFCFVIYGIYLLLRFFKYGTSHLQFNQFPFLIGDQVNVTLSTKAIPGLKDMAVTLRCIEEQYETRGSGKNRHTVVVSYQLYADTLKVENAGAGQYNRFYLPVISSLPVDKNLETALSARPAKYWQIEFKAATPGIDYVAGFLLPVYARREVF